MNEKEIIYTAIDNLKEDRIELTWEEGFAKDVDGIMTLHVEHHPPVRLFVELKKEVRNHHLHKLEQLADEHKPLILVAEKIAPILKAQLKDRKLNYLEANGNMFLVADGLYITIIGKKNVQNKTTTNRAFTKTGLTVVYLFLINENWVNRPYRDITNVTGTGLGNINNIFNGLKQEKFLLQLTKDELKLKNKKMLLEKWLTEYERRLKPTLVVGKFRFLKEEDFYEWKRIPLKNGKTYWGGEPAGALLTEYLRPEELTIYTSEEWNDLIRHYRLVPDKNGNVHIYKKFWKIDGVNDNVVHPLLAYTDLMNKGDRRCTETAQRIYDEYLQDKF